MSLDPDGQEAEGGGTEGHEHAAFSGQPLHRGQEEGPAPGGEVVHNVGHAGQQVRQRQVPDEEVHAAVEALVLAEGQEDHDVLQNDQHADEEQHHRLTDVIAAGAIPFPGVVVVFDDDQVHAFLQLVPHPFFLPPFTTYFG